MLPGAEWPKLDQVWSIQLGRPGSQVTAEAEAAGQCSRAEGVQVGQCLQLRLGHVDPQVAEFVTARR